MKKLFLILSLIVNCQLSIVNSLQAQIPDTDIFLVSMQNDSGKFTFGTPENITNRKGYDNQPRFDNTVDLLYYVSQPDSTQTEIYLYNILTKKSFQLTHTPQSEYSPTPLRDNKHVACVRVDADSSQHLYIYTRSGNFPVNLTPKNDSVGYFCHIDKSTYALWVLGKKITLQIFNVDSNKIDTIAINPGRCLQNIPGKFATISYTQKTSDSTWTIMQFESFSKKKTEICKSLIGSEDYAWTPDLKILSGKDGKLFMYDTKTNEGWKQVADFSKSIGNFYRIAIAAKGKYIALVGYKGKKP
ncbi:MAG: hypothetical protein ABI723_24010 [Bacteroidia bacterium]